MNERSSEKNKILRYLIMYLIFGFGGIAIFLTKEDKIYFSVFLILAAFFLNKKLRVSNVAFVFLSLTIIFFAQLFQFGGGTFINISLIYLIFLIPYLAIIIVGKDFYKYYVNIIYFFSIIGLIFYSICLISEPFHELLSELPILLNTDPTEMPDDAPPEALKYFKQSIIIYTYEVKLEGEPLRNPGPFWEPGAYATFLALALVFNLIITKKLLNIKSIVFIVSLITTFSTAGYFSLFILLGYYFLEGLKISLYLKMILFFLILGLFVFAYNKLDFLGQKISSQFDYQNNVSLNYLDEGRFLSAKRALFTIAKYPVFGRGLVKPTAAKFGDEEAVAYGISAMLVRVGIPFFIFTYLFWYKALKILCKVNGQKPLFAFIGLISISFVLFSQALYFSPIYLMLFYIPFIHKDPNQNNKLVF